LKSESFRSGLDVDFVGSTIVRCLHVFEEKAEELFPYLLEYSSKQTRKYRELIGNRIERINNRLFVKQSIAVIVPEIQEEIIEGIKQDIEKEMNEIPVLKLGSFPFTTLSFRYEQEGELRFEQSVLKIHQDIPKSAEFPEFVGEVRAIISSHVKDVETVKRQQYAKHVEDEIEEEKAAREAKYKEDMAKMEKEEAEKLRTVQEERDTAERQRKEGEAQSEMAWKQSQAMMQQQFEQQKQQNEAMIQLQERSIQERDQLYQSMMNATREADARAATQRQEELRLQAAREKSLQEQIQQLANRPPVIIRERRGCNVC
jgi:flagellar biosynthesis GTPase FlhF